MIEATLSETYAQADAKRAALRRKRTCEVCNKVFINAKAKDHHRRMKHAKRLGATA